MLPLKKELEISITKMCPLSFWHKKKNRELHMKQKKLFNGIHKWHEIENWFCLLYGQ